MQVSSATDVQKLQLQHRSNTLLRRIEAWQNCQILFMPSVSALRDEWIELSSGPHPPEDVPLFLPSQLNGRAACPRTLEMIELRLREGQAHDALNELRQGLRSRAYMLKFKDRFLRGQGANTRACNCVKALDAKINSAADKYRVGYRSFTILSESLGHVGWKEKLRPLADADIRALTDTFDLRPGEGRRKVSWIWRTYGSSEQVTEDELSDGFQEGRSPSTNFVDTDLMPPDSNSCRMVQGTRTRTLLGRRGSAAV